MDILKSGALKVGIDLSSLQLELFEAYYHELKAWNQKLNLTAITDYKEVQIKHFLDSLTIVTAIPPELLSRSISVIDIGTGAGLPGIPLKIALPYIQLTLLEATAKKCRFLEHLLNKLGLSDVEMVNARAEEAGHNTYYREKYDLVLSRAVAPLPTLVELALPFCVTGGRFIPQKKGDIKKELEQSSKAIDILGGRVVEDKVINIEELNDDRSLVIIEKVKVTPPHYSRRPGMPAKRPIA